MILRCFSTPEEKIRLTFYSCDEKADPGDYYVTCDHPLTVYKTDYTKLLLPYLQYAQPDFDECLDNWIPEGKWRGLIQQMEAGMDSVQFDDTVFDFYSKFIVWITKALEHDNMIVVEGNQ